MNPRCRESRSRCVSRSSYSERKRKGMSRLLLAIRVAIPRDQPRILCREKFGSNRAHVFHSGNRAPPEDRGLFGGVRVDARDLAFETSKVQGSWQYRTVGI